MGRNKKNIKGQKEVENKKSDVVRKNKSSKVKTNKKVEPNKVQTSYTKTEVGKLLKYFLIVLIIFVIFWGLTIFIKNNRKVEPTNVKNNSVTIIQYDEILVGEILEQAKDEYFVLVLNNLKTEKEVYESYIKKSESDEESLKIYTVNLNSAFNSNFISDESNFRIKYIKDIKFKDSTLLKIEEGRIVEYFEGQNEILEYLNSYDS